MKSEDTVEGSNMPTLSVRQLKQSVYEQLRIRAATHNVSMEEEARQIIAQAVSAPERISDVFRKHFGSKHGIDIKIPKRGKSHQPMDFKE